MVGHCPPGESTIGVPIMDSKNSPVLLAVAACLAVVAVLGILAYRSHSEGDGVAIIYIIAASLVGVIGIPFAVAGGLVVRDGIEDDSIG